MIDQYCVVLRYVLWAPALVEKLKTQGQSLWTARLRFPWFDAVAMEGRFRVPKVEGTSLGTIGQFK